MIRGITKPYGEKTGTSEPVRCQKCGKPIGYVTVLARGLIRFSNPSRTLRLLLSAWNVPRRKNSSLNRMKNAIAFSLFVFF